MMVTAFRQFRRSLYVSIAFLVPIVGCSGGGGGSTPTAASAPSTSVPSASNTAAASAPPSGTSPTATPRASATATATASSPAAGAATPTASPIASAAATPTAVPTASLAGAPGTLYVETPLASDSLADSIGVNTHIATYFSASDYQTVVARVASLGVRHIRDGILDTDPPYNTAVTSLLSAANAKLDGITDCTGIAYYAQSPTSAIDIQGFNSGIGSRLEMVEGPNEVDSRNDANWVTDTRNCLPALRSALPSLPFAAPSLADPSDNASALGDISSLVDMGNAHRYFSGHNPGTPGWGSTSACGVYGALSWALCETRINSGSKPIVITESGYNSQTEVDEATQAKYLGRLPLVNLKGGVVRTYIYDLKDYVGDGFGGDGLLRTDDSEKPAYTAIASEIHYFSDPGSAVPPVPLSYALSAPGISHLLFMKRNGSYVLALWNETASWDTNTNEPISVSPISVILTLPFSPGSIQAMTISSTTGALQSTAISKSGNSYTLPVGDSVTLVDF